MPISDFTVHHVQVEANKAFAEVTKSFERRLGKFDPAVLRSTALEPESTRSRIEAMAGKSGFMLFDTMDHGAILSLFGVKKLAVQYVVGHPLIAIQMTRHNVAAGLYAPLRVLIYENVQGKTCLEYDKPSSLFGQFHNQAIDAVAATLDQKLEDLVKAAVG
ncbi:MAG TPA: DUF302 domain-containing protein [Isosphaeraceae bacterium]|jgi:uncharacterized protein (DUF302 family)|nr:DUF302 domain-containing protein [Isosphaeraceae bacterium]